MPTYLSALKKATSAWKHTPKTPLEEPVEVAHDRMCAFAKIPIPTLDEKIQQYVKMALNGVSRTSQVGLAAGCRV